MTTASPAPDIPWRHQIAALIAVAYACRDCGRRLVTDDDPPVIEHDQDGRQRLDRLVVLCRGCAGKRAADRAEWPPVKKLPTPTNWKPPSPMQPSAGPLPAAQGENVTLL